MTDGDQAAPMGDGAMPPQQDDQAAPASTDAPASTEAPTEEGSDEQSSM